MTHVFHSFFRKKNRFFHYTQLFYCLMAVLGAAALICIKFHSGIVLFTIFSACMALRASYFIHEKLIVDVDNGTVVLKLAKKRFEISTIRSVKKIRPGQIRLVNREGKQFPVSVENEDDFISLLQTIHTGISVD